MEMMYAQSDSDSYKEVILDSGFTRIYSSLSERIRYETRLDIS